VPRGMGVSPMSGRSEHEGTIFQMACVAGGLIVSAFGAPTNGTRVSCGTLGDVFELAADTTAQRLAVTLYVKWRGTGGCWKSASARNVRLKNRRRPHLILRMTPARPKPASPHCARNREHDRRYYVEAPDHQ